MSLVYLNGEWCAPEQAKVSVLDRGFLFGDGVYEVVPAFSGVLFQLMEHLARFERSMQAIHLINPYSREQWQQLLNELLHKNGGGEQSVYVQITRGVAKRDHVLPAYPPPTVFAMCNPIVRHNSDPVSVITHEDIRWQNCHIKAIALLPNVLLRMQAAQSGAYEAILFRNGKLTEGAASNVFIVKDGIIKTPPLSDALLAGVTRMVIDSLVQHDLPYQTTDISKQEVFAADEIWLSGSNRELLPVTQIDGLPVGDGKIGKLWHQVESLYRAFRDREIERALHAKTR